MTQKHKIAAEVQQELQKFIGQLNDPFTAANIRSDVFHVLWRFSDELGFPAKLLPEIELKIQNHTIVVSLTDPKTGELLTTEEWVLRAEGGFYG